MKQIIQYQKTGEMKIDELPVPIVREGWVLVKNHYSLISSGTEKTSVETAKASMLGKAKSRPDLVKQVMQNVKREGILSTYNKVKTRLDSYKELGYSCAGVVIESGTDEFKTGDRVACAGATANHSEYVLVPQNLCVKVTDSVNSEEAAFTTLGAIAMQGIRQSEINIGEYVGVIGMGLLGLITIQLAKLSGCRVIGIDLNDSNFETAKKLGCDFCLISNEECIATIDSITKGIGTDAVIITAGTKSNDPIDLALNIARKKSRIVVVGAVGMNIPRSPFYEKEIDLRISCSYGPGRYDVLYEEFGIDYPVGYVRWTENRNMQSIIDLLSQRKLDFASLITHKIPIEKGLEAYDIITGKSKEKFIGVLIEYNPELAIISRKLELRATKIINESINIGFIGAGNFAQSYLIPPLKEIKVNLYGVCTSIPVNSKSVGEKFDFKFCTSDYKDVLDNSEINTVFVATRHDSHSYYVKEALKAGKNVYVEKPLAISIQELKEISNIYYNSDKQPLLMVGFNRRFSRAFTDIKEFFKINNEPYFINYRVHAGHIPKSHWIQHPDQGGRILGEGCHFIDTMQFITDSYPKNVFARSIRSENSSIINDDNVIITIEFENGSVGNLLYLANGDISVPKEYCEIFAGGKTAIMNNFKENLYFANGKTISKKYNGEKGHKEEVRSFINAVKGIEKPGISFESIYCTTLASLKALDSLKNNTVIEI
ncbi:MAG: bi-domain-containing oxidoreductase [Candidatus Kapaibacterium sp.]